MLARRQPDLTVCMEQVHKPHNVSAVIRTADAVGVHEVHAVWPSSRMRTMASAAAGSNSWVQVKTHRTIADAVGHLKGQGMQILATHLSDKAIDFREIDYTRPTCILMGQEKTGITQEALALADQDIIIPMIGMVQSLNVSVASALILYEAQRQRQKRRDVPTRQQHAAAGRAAAPAVRRRLSGAGPRRPTKRSALPPRQRAGRSGSR